MIRFSILMTLAACGLFAPVSTAQPKFSEPKFSFSYWNDNLVLESFLGVDIPEGNDDHFTANFLFDFSFEYHSLFVNPFLYLNIITHDKADYRTDLLAFYLTAKQKTLTGDFGYGLGLIANGDFKGDAIQNAYHRNFGHPHVDLPYYSETKTGVSLWLKYQQIIWERRYFNLRGYLKTDIRTAVVPPLIRAGLNPNLLSSIIKKNYRICFDVQFGYAVFFDTDCILDDHFSSGEFWGARLTAGKLNRLSVAFWVNHNHNGLQQPYFGFTIEYPMRKYTGIRMEKYMFP